MTSVDTVRLRPVEDADALIHAAFPPEPEIVRMYGGTFDPAATRDPSASRAWVDWLREQPFARIILADDQPVGAIRLHSLSHADRRARLALGLFSGRFLGRGIGRRAIALTLDHAFGPMGLNRVDLRVLAYNHRAIRCYEACGFRHEGVEREAAFVDGQWHDDRIMGILAREWSGLPPTV